MSINKTQYELISRLVNRYDRGNYKKGWTLTVTNEGSISLCLQKLNEGNQAHKLAEKYPDIFEAKQVMFRCVDLYLLNDAKARELIK